jgi:hypothetical protein
MSVPSELLMNTQNSFQTHAQRGANIVMRGGKRKSKRTKRMARKSRRKSRRRKQQKGGHGRTISYANLDFMANNRLGKMVPHGDAYTNCNTQSGGGFGFTQQGANDAATFKGSYPAFQKYEKSKQCGGKRRRRRKSRKSRKSKRKSRRKSRKSRRKRRKSRRRRRRRGGRPPPCEEDEKPWIGCREASSGGQKGGSSHTYGAPFAGGDKPWATAPLGISKNPVSCYDNYNHFKGL